MWVYEKNIIKRDVCVCSFLFLFMLLNYKNKKGEKELSVGFEYG